MPIKEAVLDTMLAMSIHLPLIMALLDLANTDMLCLSLTLKHNRYFGRLYILNSRIFNAVAIAKERRTPVRLYFEQRRYSEKTGYKTLDLPK